MLKVVQSNQFRKDLKLAKKRGLDLNLLNEVVDKLCAGEQLPPKNKNHKLSHEYKGFFECHIEPNWLLIYKIQEEKVLLYLFRTGSHSDLFR